MARAQTQQLVVDLKLQDGLSGGLAAAKSQLTGLDDTARKTGTSLGGLSSSLGGIAKAGVVAFAGFKALDVASDFLSGAVKGAIEEEQGITRLSASLKANVTAWDGNTKAVESAISAREALGFSDGELRDSLGSLVAVTKDVNKALDIQSVAEDLARFKQVSLQDATAALITVEAGRYRGLAQLGIVLKEGATQTEALAAVQAVAAGQAEKFGDTTAGAMAEAKIAVDDLKEDVGKGLTPVLKEAAHVLTDLLDSSKHPTSIGAAIGTAFGIITDPEHAIAKINALTDAIYDEATAARDAAGHIKGLTDIEADAIGRVEALTPVTRAAATAFQSWVQIADNTGVTLDLVAQKALGTVDGIDAAAAAANKLGNALDALPRETELSVTTRFFQAGAGAFAVGEFNPGPAGNTDTGPTSGSTGSLTGTLGDPAFVAAQAQAARERAAALALSAAKQRAAELAAAYRETVSNAFDKAKRTADSLFDTLHSRHIQAIKDAETLAEKNHDAAIQAISDNLKAQQSANAAPVTAAEQELRDRQAIQQRRDLVEALQAAKAGTTDAKGVTTIDPLAIRSATEALQNFDAGAVIDRLKDVQTGLDTAAQNAANAATATADAELAAAKVKAQNDTDAQTKADAKAKDAFELQLAALKDRDLKLNKTPAQLQADIAALEKRFGITTDKRGFHHIDDPLVTAIKDLRDTPPTFIVQNAIAAYLQLNQQQLRLIASAIQQSAQPAATAGSRTGTTGR